MNKQDLIEKVQASVKNPMTHADAERCVNAFIDAVKEALIAGDSVQLVGFGTFETRSRAAKEGRNPQTGEPVHIPACKTPAFKPAKAFKTSVNE